MKIKIDYSPKFFKNKKKKILNFNSDCKTQITMIDLNEIKLQITENHEIYSLHYAYYLKLISHTKIFFFFF